MDGLNETMTEEQAADLAVDLALEYHFENRLSDEPVAPFGMKVKTHKAAGMTCFELSW